MNKEESLKVELRNLIYAASSTLEMINDGSLNEEMKSTMPFLMESYFKGIAAGMDYESTLLKERESRFAEIKEYNMRISELEDKLSNATSTSGIREKLQNLSDTVYEWWQEEGFDHISDIQYSQGGIYQSELVCRANQDCEENKKEELKKMGFAFGDGLGRDYEDLLLDTDSNRKLLINLIRSKFPSSKVYSYENRVCYSKKIDADIFMLRSVKFGIYNLEDIAKEQ